MTKSTENENSIENIENKPIEINSIEHNQETDSNSGRCSSPNGADTNQIFTSIDLEDGSDCTKPTNNGSAFEKKDENYYDNFDKEKETEKLLYKPQKKTKVKVIPPDGGWGWLVCAGSFMISVSIDFLYFIILEQQQQ